MEPKFLTDLNAKNLSEIAYFADKLNDLKNVKDEKNLKNIFYTQNEDGSYTLKQFTDTDLNELAQRINLEKDLFENTL